MTSVSRRMRLATGASRVFATSLVWLLLIVPDPRAAVIHVPGDIPAIEDALAQAQPYDTVLVAPGAYEPASPLIFEQPHVTLLAEVEREAIVIRGYHGWYELVDVQREGCVIEGLYFVSSPSIISVAGAAGNTRIEGNRFEAIGFSPHGVLDYGTSTRILDNEFTGCVGPIYANGPSVLVEGNTIRGNIAGVILTRGGTIRGNTIEENWNVADYGEAGSGGGIAILSAAPPVLIEDNRIELNRTDGWYPEGEEGHGGGIYALQSFGVTIRNNRIIRNQALNGAGIFAEDCAITISGNLVSANHDSIGGEGNPLRGRGGGIHLRNCTGRLEANTIHGNTALIHGGGVLLEGPDTPVIERNIVASNVSEGAGVACQGTGEVLFSCNDAWGNGTANYTGCPDPTGTGGNISADPLFCPPFFDEFLLRDDSPCAPENAPPGCGRIGAYDVGCQAADAPGPALSDGETSLRVYPNPGGARLTIVWSGRQAAPVTIEIRDVAGRHVRSLTGGPVLHWDRRNEAGAPVASGLYFVRVRDHGGLDPVKLLILD